LGNNTNIDTTPEALRFNISIGGGATQNIDLGARLRNTVGVTTTAVTAAQIKTAMEAELQAKFDDSITVSAGGAAAAFVIQDAQGRSIDLSQGSGNGAIFGTDSANSGALSAVANPQNNLSVAWSGNDLLITNKAGAETTIGSYAAAGGASVVFDASGSIPGQVQNPVTLVAAAFSDPKVTANGSTETSQLSMNFSNRSDTADVYKFKITDGAAHVYADLTSLDLGKDISNATIETAVKTALATGVALLGDKSITANDFDVSFNGSTLNIKARDGLSLGIENFSSAAGSATVTPMNEAGKATLLASQNAYQSEVRLGLNAAAFNVKVSTGTDTGKFDVWVDGIKATAGVADVTAKLDGTYADSKAFGDAIATEMQKQIRAVTDVVIGASAVNQDLTKVTVTYDATAGQLVIKDPNGRAISLQSASTNELQGSGTVFLQDGVTGVANKVAQVKTSSNVAKGGLYNVTKMDVSLSANKVDGLNFKLNGVALSATAWDSTQPFEGSAAQTSLNTMMATLNGAHPDAPYEYSVSGNTISFTRRDGGELSVDNFATASTSSAVTATITPAAGQGTGKVVNYNEILDTAKASGTASVATSAKLKFNSPDLIGLTVSDGSKSYTMNSTALDISDRSSVNSFLKTLNKTLAGSNITASMDLQGNLFLADQLGGTVAVTGYSSAAGQSAAWTPTAGQGDALSIQSGFVGSASAVGVAGSTIAVGGGSTSVAQISIATQQGAQNAIAVVDKALSYVNAERSKLGAIENRLTHTVDNLTNIVTNTSASKSRIVDTDYATETTELARAQIISQAATAMLAQANQSAQGVLSLLK
jgi:flagellin